MRYIHKQENYSSGHEWGRATHSVYTNKDKSHEQNWVEQKQTEKDTVDMRSLYNA